MKIKSVTIETDAGHEMTLPFEEAEKMMLAVDRLKRAAAPRTSLEDVVYGGLGSGMANAPLQPLRNTYNPRYNAVGDIASYTTADTGDYPDGD